MSSREQIHVRTKLDIDPIPEPNRVIPQVQVEIRISHPKNATAEQIRNTLAKAVNEARREIDEKLAPRCPECVHLQQSHYHGSFGGMAECLEMVTDGPPENAGRCWCKYYSDRNE